MKSETWTISRRCTISSTAAISWQSVRPLGDAESPGKVPLCQPRRFTKCWTVTNLAAAISASSDFCVTSSCRSAPTLQITNASRQLFTVTDLYSHRRSKNTHSDRDYNLQLSERRRYAPKRKTDAYNNGQTLRYGSLAYDQCCRAEFSSWNTCRYTSAAEDWPYDMVTITT